MRPHLGLQFKSSMWIIRAPYILSLVFKTHLHLFIFLKLLHFRTKWHLFLTLAYVIGKHFISFCVRTNNVWITVHLATTNMVSTSSLVIYISRIKYKILKSWILKFDNNTQYKQHILYNSIIIFLQPFYSFYSYLFSSL